MTDPHYRPNAVEPDSFGSMPESNVPSLNQALTWFETNGGTDRAYLSSSYDRFAKSFEYVNGRIEKTSVIADIGAHWLHQAFFFATSGHRVSAFDVPTTMTRDNVKAQARLLQIDLNAVSNLEKPEFQNHESSTFDAILFFEIIEHITFNPIRMWSEIFRIAKPGAKIFVSTPNAMHHERLLERLTALEGDLEYGIALEDIFRVGTYGHHWKEYSITELRRYFGRFEPSFRITDEFFFSNRPDTEERWRHTEHLAPQRPKFIDFGGLISTIESSGGHPFARQMVVEITVSEHKEPINLAAPW